MRQTAQATGIIEAALVDKVNTLHRECTTQIHLEPFANPISGVEESSIGAVNTIGRDVIAQCA